MVPTKPSIFPAAELAATMTEPKEFTADWISTLEIEKSMLCIPAGRPIFNISLSFCLSIHNFCGVKRMALSVLYRQLSTNSIERYCEITVAHATPLTLMLSTITKRRLSITLTIPEKMRKFIGLRLSPIARSIAAQKL